MGICCAKKIDTWVDLDKDNNVYNCFDDNSCDSNDKDNNLSLIQYMNNYQTSPYDDSHNNHNNNHNLRNVSRNLWSDL